MSEYGLYVTYGLALLIQRVHQDRLDRLVAILAHGMRARTRGPQAGGGKPLREAQDALGAAQAIEGTVAEQRVDDEGTGGTDLGGAIATPDRCLHEEVDLVRRQMIRELLPLAAYGSGGGAACGPGGLTAWVRGQGRGREGAERVDVDYPLDVGNVSTARATSSGAPYRSMRTVFTASSRSSRTRRGP